VPLTHPTRPPLPLLNQTFRQNLLFTLMVLSAIMIYLTYTPSDSRYFWTYWVSWS